jgi:hypothetical protein
MAREVSNETLANRGEPDFCDCGQRGGGGARGGAGDGSGSCNGETPDAPSSTTGTGKIAVREGTDVSLKFAQDLSSKTAAEDDPVNLVLAEDLKVGDVVIAKAGSKAVGTITHAQKAGMMGKAGELNMRLQYLLVGDTRVKLRGTKGKEGQGKEGTAVALTVLFGPIGLIKHGKNVDIKEGTPLQAYTDETYELPVSK